MPVNKTTEFGTFHIADNPAAYQPIRNNNFRCLVYGLDDLLVVGGVEGDERDHIRNGQEVIDFSVVSFNPPSFSQNPIVVSRGNSQVKYAGTPQWSQGSLVINEYAGVNSKSILQAWQALSYDVFNDIIPRVDNYKKEIVVLEYLPDNTLVCTYNLHGCWIQSLQETGWQNGQSNIKTMTATIAYDRADWKLAE